jgi:predicted RNA-binding Zn-ribbon protein involved in translation (DUF1610 family)
MSPANKSRGPWLHRFLIGLFTVLLALLSVWLIGFVLDDIGTIPGPDYAEVEKGFLSRTLLDDAKSAEEQLAELGRKLREQQGRQSLLRDSTSRYEQTMRQLVELQRLNVEKGITSDEAAQKALAESAAFFLANQKADQALNEDVTKLTEQMGALENRKRGIENQLETEREPARKEFRRLQHRHDRKLAFFKLSFLLPLLAGVVVLFLRKRNSGYAPILYAVGVAVLWHTVMVIHEHFPTRYFKYIVLCALLAGVAYTLVTLLRMLRSPKKGWLLKQYREAYEKFECPVCEYPIRRGPRKFLFWTRRTIKKLAVPESPDGSKDEPYACPSCGSQLFEECGSCHAIRHSMLPYCDQCGAEKVGAESA